MAEDGAGARIIVHVGLQKTGSSAIQVYLAGKRKALADGGVLYPDLGANSHWQLTVALSADKFAAESRSGRVDYLRRRAEARPIDNKKVLGTVVDAIRSLRDGQTLILSHESFSTGQRAKALFQLLKEHAPAAETFAIGYVRDPVAAYASGVQQVLKGRQPLPTPSTWKSTHPVRARGVRRAFGNGVILRAYDRTLLAKGDVVEDFREVVNELIGHSLPTAGQTLTTNSSLPGWMCALLLRHERSDVAGERSDFSNFRKALGAFGGGADAPRLRIPAAWEATLAAVNHATWNRVVDTLPYDPPTKDRLRLVPPDGPVAKPGLADVDRWIDSYFDPSLTGEFITYLRGDNARSLPPRVLDWLEKQVGC